MATDRGAVLTVRAAVRGVVDFRQARLQDARWWRSANILIDRMAADDRADNLRAEFDYQCALVGNSGLDPNDFKKIQGRAAEIYRELSNVCRPWLATSEAATKEKEVNDLIGLYKKQFGDPKDPVFRQALLAEAEELRAREKARNQAKPETELERITRLRQDVHNQHAGRPSRPPGPPRKPGRKP